MIQSPLELTAEACIMLHAAVLQLTIVWPNVGDYSELCYPEIIY